MKFSEISDSVSSTMLATQASKALEEENAALKAQLAETSSGEFIWNINRFRPSIQARQTFITEEIARRGLSLLQEGQAKAVILLPLEGDSNHEAEIEDGELTWRAAQWLVEQGHKQWQDLRCSWSKLTSGDDSHTNSMIHHTSQIVLNPLDKAEGLMVEIAKAITWEEDEVEGDQNAILKPIIGSIATQYQRKPEFTALYDSLSLKTKAEALTILEEWPDLSLRHKTVITQLIRFAVNNPGTFYKNGMQLVFLNDQLKAAIRHSVNPLSVKHVLSLNRVKDTQIQQDLIEQAQANHWSIKELNSAIAEALPSKTKTSNLNSFTTQKSAVQSLNKPLNTPSMKKLTGKQAEQLAATLRKKLEVLEEVIQSSSAN